MDKNELKSIVAHSIIKIKLMNGIELSDEQISYILQSTWKSFKYANKNLNAEKLFYAFMKFKYSFKKTECSYYELAISALSLLKEQLIINNHFKKDFITTKHNSNNNNIVSLIMQNELISQYHIARLTYVLEGEKYYKRFFFELHQTVNNKHLKEMEDIKDSLLELRKTIKAK